MKICEICAKSTTVGVNSTHNYGGGWARRGQRTRKVWKPNLRTAKILEATGAKRTMKICMKCYKALRSGKFTHLELAHNPRQSRTS
jgi:ribosomal protein L28